MLSIDFFCKKKTVHANKNWKEHLINQSSGWNKIISLKNALFLLSNIFYVKYLNPTDKTHPVGWNGGEAINKFSYWSISAIMSGGHSSVLEKNYNFSTYMTFNNFLTRYIRHYTLNQSRFEDLIKFDYHSTFTCIFFLQTNFLFFKK